MRQSYVLAGLFGALIGCAKANPGGGDPDAGGADAIPPDASCGDHCDHDNDGVFDPMDQCPNTPAGEIVNHVGCSDSQLTATLVPFPPFNLTWTSAGNLGRAGGLTWTYDGIQRKDLFHIYWIICDDAADACGVSLDGLIDNAAEHWAYAAATSDLANGKIQYTNTTHILLADTTMPQLNGRLTLTIVDGSTAIIPFSDIATLKVTPMSGTHGAEIKGTAFSVVALAEVQDPTSMLWSPYLDYYDAAATPDTGGTAQISYGGSFYSE